MAETIKYSLMSVIFVFKELEKLTEKIEKDCNVLAVVLFGSYIRDERFSDVDVCIVFKPRKKLKYSIAFPDLDIQIFQQLPLPIKNASFEGRQSYILQR